MCLKREMGNPEQDHQSGRVKVFFALLSVYFIWGSTYLAIRIGLEGLPPFFMAGVRFIVAGTMLYLYLRAKGVPNPSRPELTGASLVGGLLLLGGNGGVCYAEQWVSSGLAALVISSTPLWVLLFSSIWGHRPSRIEVIGLALGLAGVVILNMEGDLKANPAGAVALLFAAIFWAFGSAWSRRLSLPPGLMACAIEMMAGGALLFVASASIGEKVNGMPGWRSLSALLYLIVVGSLVGFSSYMYLLGKVRPALATSYAYVNPVVAVCLGVGLAGERISGKGLAAMAVIISGVVLVIFGQRKG